MNSGARCGPAYWPDEGIVTVRRERRHGAETRVAAQLAADDSGVRSAFDQLLST